MKSIACVLVLSICVLAGEHDVSRKTLTGESKGCLSPYILIGDRCLLFESVTKNTWNEMRKVCQYYGGDLVKLDTIDVMSGIIEFVRENGAPDGSYWVGASDIGQEGSWVWSDGTPAPLGVPLWQQCNNQQPNGDVSENCAVMFKAYSFLLADQSCSALHYGICEM